MIRCKHCHAALFISGGCWVKVTDPRSAICWATEGFWHTPA